MVERGNGPVQTPRIRFHDAGSIGTAGSGAHHMKSVGAGERGATIVEMAIVLPLLLLLVVGMLELGLAFRSYLTVSAAARDGVRVASLAGNDPDADCFVLQEVGGTLAGGSAIDNLQRVEIYKASPGTGAVVGSPNVYTLTVGGDPTDCSDWAGSDSGYPQTARQTISGPGQPLDIVGVRVLVQEAWITGLFPFNGTYQIDERSVSRLEPEAYQ